MSASFSIPVKLKAYILHIHDMHEAQITTHASVFLSQSNGGLFAFFLLPRVCLGLFAPDLDALGSCAKRNKWEPVRVIKVALGAFGGPQSVQWSRMATISHTVQCIYICHVQGKRASPVAAPGNTCVKQRAHLSSI